MGAGSSAIAVLVPVISGFIFNLIFHPVRYFSSRAEGQKLFFMSAGSGIHLSALVFLVVSVIKPFLHAESRPFRLAQFVNQSIPTPYARRFIFAFISSVAICSFLNLFSEWIVPGTKLKQQLLKSKSRTRAQRLCDRLADSNGSFMAQLFRRAADKQTLVVLTLKSRKIYCGRIFEVPPNIDEADACIEILPSFSAHRDKYRLRMGEARTEHPVLELWIARQRLYTLEENNRLLDQSYKRMYSKLIGMQCGLDLVRKFLRRIRRLLRMHGTRPMLWLLGFRARRASIPRGGSKSSTSMR